MGKTLKYLELKTNFQVPIRSELLKSFLFKTSKRTKCLQYLVANMQNGL